MRDVLHLTEPSDIRTNGECQKLSDEFAAYFINKIQQIKTTISSRLAGRVSDPLQSDPVYVGARLIELSVPTVDEVSRLIRAMPAESSPIDAIPTSVIKTCVDIFAPVICRLIQLSFNEDTFPSSFKTASVTTLFKKKGLDRDDIANYRPISNLHTISKIVERLFPSRLIAHVEQSSSFNRFQSAYRRCHSTETALLR